MTDENVKTTKTESKYTSDNGKSEIKTKEVSTEKKTTVTDPPEKVITVTTVED